MSTCAESGGSLLRALDLAHVLVPQKRSSSPCGSPSSKWRGHVPDLFQQAQSKACFATEGTYPNVAFRSPPMTPSGTSKERARSPVPEAEFLKTGAKRQLLSLPTF